MSAFLCDPEHVGALASWLCEPARNLRPYAARELREGDRLTVGAGVWPDTELAPNVATALAAENVASVAHRYPDDTEGQRPGPSNVATDLDYLTLCAQAARRRLPPVDPVRVLKALDCLEYQSCEHPGWRESTGRALLELARRQAIAELPGYDDAPWGWGDR